MTNPLWLGVAVALCLLFTLAPPVPAAPAAASECLKCHSDVGRLLTLTRELAKTRPALASAESEGEG
jgi:hypothetical protein